MSTHTSFVDKLISQKGHLIHKLRAIDITGNIAYYFVMIDHNQELKFKRAIETGVDTLDFADYGKVIASCYGETPSEEVRKLLKEKYNFCV